MDDAREKLRLAKDHLEKVHQAVGGEPVDLALLYIFGQYAMEVAASAAGAHVGISEAETHPGQVRLAQRLHDEHGLPDIQEMLRDLQRNRLHEAYGKLEPSGKFDPQDIAVAVEEYVDAVTRFIDG